MTGVETAAAASALAAGSGAAAGGTAAALGAGAAGAGALGAGATITAAEAAALGLTAAEGASAAAAGMTAAEAAAAAGAAGATEAGAAAAGTAAAEAGTAATAAETGGGLLASGAPETSGLLTQSEMLAAQNAGLEGAGQATNQALLSNQQAAMLAEQNAGLLGAEQATNAAADPALAQGMQKPWYQQTGEWLGEKPFGESGPSRGKMIQKGGQAMYQAEQPQQQQAAPAAAPMIQPSAYQPVANSSPYGKPAFGNAAQSPFSSAMQNPYARQYGGMGQYMRRR